ncbi:AMP-binding protein [Azohydromonas lata]|uniref:AMP-binding protein n=1 Tax=Azohydromonas lata TaxID=45677 RepID=UPI00082E69F4|nr:AMP-binding protein [Azohydromonas lata]
MGIDADRALWRAETFGAGGLLCTTIGDMLDQQAQERPHREALVYRYPEIGLEVRWTYRALRDKANEVAKGLMALGVRSGDKVAVLATNVPEWVLMQMALPKIGAVLVTVNTNYRRVELEYLLRQADVHTIVLIEENRGNEYLQSLKSIAPEIDAISDPERLDIQSAALPALRRAVLIGGEARRGLVAFDRLPMLGASVADEALARRQNLVKPEDVSQIQFTSGTTGAPKGAMLTYRGTLNNARLVAQRAGLAQDDRFLTAMPLFHAAGNVVNQLSMLVAGGTIIKAIAFDAVKMLSLIEQEKATVMDAVPTMYIAMLQEPRFLAGEFDVSSMRRVISGGTSIPVSLMEQLKSQWGAEPAIVFGMTEASPIIAQTLPEDSFELRSTTVGRPLPFTEVKIVDSEGGVVGHGQPGELLVRGYNVMKGYYKMPEQTARAIDAEGWLHSGDMASMDGRGYIRIVGRIKDMLIRGGENVYPAEVEGFLMRHPKVRQAEVVGVPDPYMGEEGAAFVRLKEGESMAEQEVVDYCRANLSRHKLPKYIRFIDAFPLTPSGKVKKFELRAQLIEELGLDATPKG